MIDKRLPTGHKVVSVCYYREGQTGTIGLTGSWDDVNVLLDGLRSVRGFKQHELDAVPHD